ncbi:MAG: hypothetical protein WBA89_05000 [Microcoleus sp.]
MKKERIYFLVRAGGLRLCRRDFNRRLLRSTAIDYDRLRSTAID